MNPIGVFDSGLGGLTIVKSIQALLPDERIIYFGDTAHLPYGDKSADLIRKYVGEISHMLVSKPVKAIVIACNTASAVARGLVENIAGDIPVFDVIQPAVEAATSVTQSSRIGVIGTKTTIGTGIYRKEILKRLPKAFVTQKATPLLVPMIEEGWLHNQVSQDVIDAYMSDTGFQDIDTLILGCTHYPLIKSQIERYFQKNYDHSIQVVDSSLAVAKTIKNELVKEEIIKDTKDSADTFYLSDITPNFEASARLFLGREVVFQKIL